MAYEENLESISVPANTDLSSYQYGGVVINSSGKVALATATAKMDGVLQNKPAAANRAATVAIDGVTKAVASGTVTAGDDLAVAANGKFALATSGDVVVGRALTGAGTGKIFSMLITPQYEPLS